MRLFSPDIISSLRILADFLENNPEFIKEISVDENKIMTFVCTIILRSYALYLFIKYFVSKVITVIQPSYELCILGMLMVWVMSCTFTWTFSRE